MLHENSIYLLSVVERGIERKKYLQYIGPEFQEPRLILTLKSFPEFVSK